MRGFLNLLEQSACCHILQKLNCYEALEDFSAFLMEMSNVSSLFPL